MIENSQRDGGYVLTFHGTRIPFRVEHRKRKKLAITVHPDLRVELVAPLDITKEQVFARVEKRAAWILRQWRYFEKYMPKHPGPRYVAGETHLYLGRQYRLRLHTGSPEIVKLIGSFLHVWTNNRDDAERIQILIGKWYRDHAERVLCHRLRMCLEQCPSLKLAHVPRITIRKMTSRWGSCTKSGHVLLNLDLIKVPAHCIDYVLIHELCHVQIHNHSPAFYRLLSRSMPDWEKRKRRLEEFVT